MLFLRWGGLADLRQLILRWRRSLPPRDMRRLFDPNEVNVWDLSVKGIYVEGARNCPTAFELEEESTLSSGTSHSERGQPFDRLSRNWGYP